MTSLPNNILKEKQYDCLGSLPVVGSYYLVMYKGKLWSGKVTQVKSGGQIVTVKYRKKVDAPKESGQSKKMSMITQSVMLNRK